VFICVLIIIDFDFECVLAVNSYAKYMNDMCMYDHAVEV